MSDGKGLATRAVGETAREGLTRSEGDRMHEDVEMTPTLFESGKSGIDLRIGGHIERQHNVRTDRLRERFHAFFELIVRVGEGEFGAFAMKGFRNTPGD